MLITFVEGLTPEWLVVTELMVRMIIFPECHLSHVMLTTEYPLHHILVFLNAVHDIRLSLLAGTKLPAVLKQAEYYIGVMKRYPHIRTYLALFRETILTLIGREFHANIKEDELSIIPAETTNYHKAIRCYWMGHTERCHYFTEKIVAGSKDGRHYNTVQHSHKRFVMLYYGINSIKMIANSRKHYKQ